MSDAAVFPLSFLRGDDYSKVWSLTDATSGASLINSGDTLALHFKRSQGGAVLATVSATADGSGSAISAISTTAGTLNIAVRSGTLESIATAMGASAQSQMSIAFAFQLTRGGLVTTYAYGPCTINPAP